jgi:hypothetical protein
MQGNQHKREHLHGFDLRRTMAIIFVDQEKQTKSLLVLIDTIIEYHLSMSMVHTDMHKLYLVRYDK